MRLSIPTVSEIGETLGESFGFKYSGRTCVIDYRTRNGREIIDELARNTGQQKGLQYLIDNASSAHFGPEDLHMDCDLLVLFNVESHDYAGHCALALVPAEHMAFHRNGRCMQNYLIKYTLCRNPS